MEDTAGKNQPKTRARRTARDEPELRFVGIDVKPAPDARDRLRRIFTILLEHPASERYAASDKDPLPDADIAGNHVEAEG